MVWDNDIFVTENATYVAPVISKGTKLKPFLHVSFVSLGLEDIFSLITHCSSRLHCLHLFYARDSLFCLPPHLHWKTAVFLLEIKLNQVQGIITRI